MWRGVTMFCNQCGVRVPSDKAVFCHKCGSRLPSLAPSALNESGTGRLAMVPKEIRGWNWGAFFFSWLWGLANNVYIGLLTFVPIFGLAIPFLLGAYGNEWAWQRKKWDSVEHFRRTQQKWARAGVIPVTLLLLLASLILTDPGPYLPAHYTDSLDAYYYDKGECVRLNRQGWLMNEVDCAGRHDAVVVNLVESDEACFERSGVSGNVYVYGDEGEKRRPCLLVYGWIDKRFGLGKGEDTSYLTQTD